MTMPHLMNCPHSDDSWCLDCVKEKYDEIEQLRATLAEVHEILGWHTDDEACEEETRPIDMVSHVNGLARQKCMAALTPNAQVNRRSCREDNFDETN